MSVVHIVINDCCTYRYWWLLYISLSMIAVHIVINDGGAALKSLIKCVKCFLLSYCVRLVIV